MLKKNTQGTKEEVLNLEIENPKKQVLISFSPRK